MQNRNLETPQGYIQNQKTGYQQPIQPIPPQPSLPVYTQPVSNNMPVNTRYNVVANTADGLGRSGLVLGLISLILVFIPSMFFLAFIVAISGLVLSINGNARTGSSSSIIGIIACSFGVIISLLLLYTYGMELKKIFDSLDGVLSKLKSSW